MFDPNTLAQLNKLKTDIQSSKDYAEGTVAATSGRFGFVRTDDGRDAFLSPEKMDRLLHGDRVKVSITENDKGKLEADLEKLISSEINKFVGQYRVKGAGHFVVPSGTQFNRWVFVPPSQRKGSKEGDYVVAKMAKHPYKDGRAQANVVFRVGQPGDDFIEHKYTKAKYDLNYRTNEGFNKQAEALSQATDSLSISDAGLEDLTDLGFFTIDSASTLDMDDALYVEKHEQHYLVYTAIAGPAQFIEQKSEIAKQAQTCGQSVYLLGGTVPMLPAQIAHHTFSLEAGKPRPSLVAKLTVALDGEVVECQFVKAMIKSHHKLSYEQVAAFLETDEHARVPEDTHATLQLARHVSELRRAWREKNYLVSEDFGDFDYRLDAKGHIESIELRSRNSAQQIVEEAMIATNIEAGKYLSSAQVGLHSVHKGFREDRIGEVHALLKEEGCDSDDINTLDGHVLLMSKLAADNDKANLVPALRRMMQASELSAEAAPHLGLGVPAYATITSPIRRFADMYNHWCIQALLAGETAPSLSDTELEQLNENLRSGRQADRELQQWLVCLYTNKLKGETAIGKIRIVTQQGFGVKIASNGIEGFVLFDKKTEKTFDAKRFTLEVEGHTYRIGQEVEIKIESVDLDKRRIAFSVLS